MRTKNPPTHTLNYPLDPKEEATITSIEDATGIEYMGCCNQASPRGYGVVTHFVFRDYAKLYHVLTLDEMLSFLKNNYFYAIKLP